MEGQFPPRVWRSWGQGTWGAVCTLMFLCLRINNEKLFLHFSQPGSFSSWQRGENSIADGLTSQDGSRDTLRTSGWTLRQGYALLSQK